MGDAMGHKRLLRPASIRALDLEKLTFTSRRQLVFHTTFRRGVSISQVVSGPESASMRCELYERTRLMARLRR